MNFSEVKELIKIMDGSDLYSLEIESSDYNIRLKKSGTSDNIRPNQIYKNLGEENLIEIEGKNQCINTYSIKSPVVGIFYASSNPDAKPFVEIGTKVKKGDVLCVIEAMKLMNEIESDVDGTIEAIMVKNGDMVDYNQTIFKINS